MESPSDHSRAEELVLTPQEPENWFACGDERERIGEGCAASMAYLGGSTLIDEAVAGNASISDAS
jgi:hypothetical protein